MKTCPLLLSSLLWLISALPPSSAQAIVAPLVSGQQLEIGPAGTDQVANYAGIYSAAFGQNNVVYSSGSLALGTNNLLAFGYSNLALGDHNEVRADNSFAVGKYHWLHGYANAAIGFGLVVEDDGQFGAGSNCLLVGSYATTDGANDSLVVGSNSWITSHRSATLGRGLVNLSNDSTFVGHYNRYELSGIPPICGWQRHR